MRVSELVSREDNIMTATASYRVSDLRSAALGLAQTMHPDQTAAIHKAAFARGATFTEVRMSGGSVLITRDMAVAWLECGK